MFSCFQSKFLNMPLLFDCESKMFFFLLFYYFLRHQNKIIVFFPFQMNGNCTGFDLWLNIYFFLFWYFNIIESQDYFYLSVQFMYMFCYHFQYLFIYIFLLNKNPFFLSIMDPIFIRPNCYNVVPMSTKFEVFQLWSVWFD